MKSYVVITQKKSISVLKGIQKGNSSVIGFSNSQFMVTNLSIDIMLYSKII